MSYDQKCFDLALVFLRDDCAEKGLPPDDAVKHADKLAQEIQTTIEDYMAFDVQAQPDMPFSGSIEAKT